jgi:uroporphyrin-III C-methyltransferase/precorrin-2 dehydrogenase/sirohydrochlorin ferrochelatase
MARLPLLMRLRGRSCLVVGAGEVGRWKAEALASCGARVTVVDPNAPPEPPNAGIAVERRAFRPSDVSSQALVVAATPDRETNRHVAAAARAQSIPVNVVDAPDESDVIFPSIVNRAPVLVAISTEGTAPVLARQLRRRIEAILPEMLGNAARFAAARRSELKAALPTTAARRQFWERFFEAVLAADGSAGAMLEEIYERQRQSDLHGAAAAPACVHVLEAPARPDELSLYALRLLNAADTLILDAAVTEAVIDHARREARHIVFRDSAAAALERIVADAAGEAVARRCVVWLRSPRHPPLADFAWLKERLSPRGVVARHIPAAPPPSD